MSGCAFMCFLLCISDVWGEAATICALMGSSVDLRCSAQHPRVMKWYTVQWESYNVIQNDLSLRGNHEIHNTNHSTLTIKDLRESDENVYCCRENDRNPQQCWYSGTKLRVTDLQVKVIPATEGQTVMLMCSTSCPLTENPAAYIWYKNREFLYEDWSPWYQELVSSEEAATYSCAVKGYEDHRAPEVSVDSVTPTCFTVTYAKGRMCSHRQTSADESCSITYPRELHVQRTLMEGYMTLTCTTSCPLTEAQTAYRWYHNGQIDFITESQMFEVSRFSNKRFSCAVKDHEDLRSAEVNTAGEKDLTLNYITRRICMLEKSSVNISSEYSHPDVQQPQSKLWYKISGNIHEELSEDSGRVVFHDNMKNRHVLTINNLKKNDSAEYKFTIQKSDGGWNKNNAPGVTLIVTGLKVTVSPSAAVTEGQRVTLTCSTSCPLTDNTGYVWYLNGRPLTLTRDRNKHLLLDPVSRRHTGNYSCVVRTNGHMRSPEEAVFVKGKSSIISNAARLTVVLLILVSFCLCMRKKKPLSFLCKNTQEETEEMESDYVVMHPVITAHREQS
ncbi:uncharacterized protein LOC125004456 [Mugil cephalus]|uniref:uncharacterized protein LOC125004456 n=1 Tax=Mugil cephalus TaxID=48193 RepID=UPI001FB7A11D|nr:uncharacterized protein LOC125004456 [Mugil cephalus]